MIRNLNQYHHFLKGYLIPIVDIDQWIATYNIKLPHTYCDKCDFVSKPILPFFDKDVRGYIKSHCACKKFPDIFFVPINKEERDFFTSKES